MNRQNTTCRIRLKDGKYKATMKRHSTGKDQSTETEMEIFDGLESNAFTNMGLKLQGELITKRCIVFKDANCEAVLDKNEYLGHKDFELEIEYTPEHEKDAQAILKIFRDMLTRRKCFLIYKEGIAAPPKVPSKSNRFFERMSITKSFSRTPLFNLSRNYTTKFEYSDPDAYMHEYFDSTVSRKKLELSRENFDASSYALSSNFYNIKDNH